MQFLRQPFPFTSGLDQIADDKQTMGLMNLVNLEWDKTGLLQKRPGTTSKPRTMVRFLNYVQSTIGDASKLIPRRDELTLVDGSGKYIHSWSPAESKWYQRDQLPEVTVTRESISQGETDAFGADVAMANGLIVYVWQSYVSTATNGLNVLGQVYTTVVDATTGAVILSNTPLSNTAVMSAPRVIVGLSGGTPIAICLYTDAGSNIYYRTLDLTNPQAGWAAQALIVTDMRLLVAGPPAQYAGSFDVVSIEPSNSPGGSATAFVLAYESTNALPNAVRVKRFLFSAPTVTTASVVLNEANSPIFCFGLQATLSECVYVSYAYVAGGNGITKVTSLNDATLATLVAPTVLYTTTAPANNIPVNCGVARIDANKACVVFQPIDQRFVCVTFTSAGLVQSGNITEQFWLSIGSRPFSYGGRTYALLHRASSVQGTFFVADLNVNQNVGTGTTQHSRPVATLRARQALSSGYGAFRPVSSLAGVAMPTATTMVSTITVSPDGVRAANEKVTVNFASTARHQYVEMGDTTAIAGGVPTSYDGVQAVELGYTYFPEVTTSNFVAANAGGSLGQGVYQYCLVYEWIDARGNLHRSAPSIPVSVTTTGVGNVNKVTITAPTYAFTNRQRPFTQYTSPVAVVTYRTLVNGSVFYRVTAGSLDRNVFSAASVNLPQVASLTLVDDMSDASLSDGTHPLIYTTGGVIPNFCPPTATSTCLYRNRLWLSSTDDEGQLWYSKGLIPGIAPEFSDAFTFRIGGSGPVTAIATMDDKLIVFRSDSIHVVYGDGANELGSGSSLDSQKLASEVGCIEPRSVALTPSGLMFQSRRGLELLTRGLETQFIGSPVVDVINTLYGVVTSAMVMPEKYQVRFTLQESAGATEGIVLIYDYVRGQWSTREYTDGNAATSTASFASAVRWSGGYVTVTVAGVVKTENFVDYRDDTTFVTSTLETDWKKMAGLSGYQRVRRVDILGTRFDSCGLTVSVGTDFDPNYAQATAYTATQLDSLPLEDIDLRVVNAKCQSLRVKVTDSVAGASPASYRGAAFSGISIEYGIYRGPRPVSANARG